MTMLPWTDEAKKRAKQDGRYLVKLQLQGKHAGRGNISFSGDVSNEIAGRLLKVLAEMVTDNVATEELDTTATRQEDDRCDHPAGCDKKAVSPGFIAGCRANFCEEHASQYSMLRDPDDDETGGGQ